MSEEKKKKFVMAEDGIAPDSVPKKKLNNGLEMPAIGMGTVGSDRFTPVQVANAVVGAAEYGQRAFDCASVYGNEKEIGESLKVILDGGVPLGFCPIGSPNRPDRDKTEMDTVDTEDPVVTKIAVRLGVHPAVVCLKWAVQRGQIPIPFSIAEDKYRSNLRCALPDYKRITDEEMVELATIDKNGRLIKGHVFLWKEGQGWEDLWDMNGKIAQ
jgi:diketogulonate reductase-like aldo/keto reductase